MKRERERAGCVWGTGETGDRSTSLFFAFTLLKLSVLSALPHASRAFDSTGMLQQARLGPSRARASSSGLSSLALQAPAVLSTLCDLCCCQRTDGKARWSSSRLRPILIEHKRRMHLCTTG